MVVFDATFLMLLLDPDADAPTGEDGLPVSQCKERIEFLIKNLSDDGVRILVPTPALSEVLVGLRESKSEVLQGMIHTYAFKIASFEEKAAIEVAFLTDADLQNKEKKLTPNERKAKVKYDRQIIAIAMINQASHIYSDDNDLCKKAKANKIESIRVSELPLPPVPPQDPQTRMNFPEAGA